MAAAAAATAAPSLAAFCASLDALCLAAGPPAPSFSSAHLEACAALALPADGGAELLDAAGLTSEQRAQALQTAQQQRAADAFAAIDAHLRADLNATPLSVRAMLWELLGRLLERSATLTQLQQASAVKPSVAAGSLATPAAAPVRDEWSLLLAPQLYRLVTQVVPKGVAEDAAPNVPVCTQTLRRWMAAAEGASAAAATSTAVRFKKHQLINALKYVESYTYVPPARTEAEIQASREAKRERKRRRKREEHERRERIHKHQRRSSDHRRRDRSDDSSASRSQSPAAAAAASAAASSAGVAVPPLPNDRAGSRSPSPSSSRSGSESRSRSRSGSSSPQRRRYRNRTSISHTASEEAYASRFLEQLRASQKRAHVEGSLRPAGESMAGWEEWAETVAYVRQAKRVRRAADTAAASAAAMSDSPTGKTAAAPTTAASPSSSLASFLSSWLFARNHWMAIRDDAGEAPEQPSVGGMHQLDQWLEHYTRHGLPLPSNTMPHGATRVWSKLTEHAASATLHGPLLPKPIPLAALHLYDEAAAAANPALLSAASLAPPTQPAPESQSTQQPVQAADAPADRDAAPIASASLG